MKSKTESSSSLKMLINFGAILMGGGNIVIVASEKFFWVGVLMVAIGAAILFPAIKKIKKKQPETPRDVKMNRFYLLASAVVLGLFAGPFFYQLVEGITLQKQFLINLALAPFLVGFLYWLMFKKIEKSK